MTKSVRKPRGTRYREAVIAPPRGPTTKGLRILSKALEAIPPLDLDVDLLLLETHQRFEDFCLRLAKREFPRVMAVSGPWDEGRDLSHFTYLHHYRASKKGRKRGSKGDGDIVWQCKFVRRLDANAKRSIKDSIKAVRDHDYVPVTRWILCLPIEPTGPFMRWLRREIEPHGWEWEVWGRRTLLDKLSPHSDLIETYFYAVYEKLRRHFATEKLELFRLELDDECQWSQQPGVLNFFRQGNVHDPDLVFDIIVRNSGRIDAALVGIEVVISERRSGPPNPSWPSPAGPRRLRAGLEPSTPGISRIM